MTNGNEWWPEWTPGFKWPWETPTGQDFQAPWTTTKPAAPVEPAPMQPMGPNYGPYSDPGQIPPELLELYDWEPFEEQYINEEGKTARITMYRLIPKAGMSEAERRRIELAEAEFMAKYGEGAAGAEPERFPLPSGQAQTTWDDSGMEWFWNEYSGRYEETGRYNQAYDMRLQQAETAVSTPEGMSAYEEDYLRLQRERLAAEQGWKQQEFGLEQQQYAAQLATQPKSWLEYAAYTGTPPVVQPWMMPLMPQQYPELAGLQAGQPVPGWPEQFTGTNVGTYGGGYQPSATTAGIGAQPTAGYGGTTPTRGGAPSGIDALMAQHPLGSKGAYPGFPQGTPPELAGGPLDYEDYIKMAQRGEMESYYATDLLRRQWELYPETKPTAGAGLYTGALGVTHPEIAERYTQAQTAAASGQPLLGGLNVQGKFDLVEQLIRQGVDRTLAERQVFGGSKTFAPYTPISDISGVAPTAPTAPYTPTPSYTPAQIPMEELAPSPKKKPTPTYKPTSIPMEESMGNVMAYIPGRSWHDVAGASSKALGEATWLARMRQLPAAGGTQAAGDTQSATPNWMGASTSQTYNPAQYAAGSWAGFNPNLPLGQMPALTRPSRQYQARMGPTALDQYYALVQGRTGITPQEMQFRLGSMAPPGGGYSGLRWMR